VADKKVAPSAERLSARRQCELLGLCRSGLYYQPAPEAPEGLWMVRLIDRE
jgi:putative transposase